MSDDPSVTREAYLMAIEQRDQLSAQLRVYEEALNVCGDIDVFQRQYEARTYDTMPGNEHYAGLLMVIVRRAREVIAKAALASPDPLPGATK